MRLTLLFILFISHFSDVLTQVSLVPVWESDSTLYTVESVIYNAESQHVYAACIYGNFMAKDGNGFIAKLDKGGHIIHRTWIEGLDAPTGLAIHQGKLYTTDIDRVIIIDIEKGAIEQRIPLADAKALNDISVDLEGTIYVSDTEGNQIFKLVGEEVSSYNSQVETPNGLLALGKDLYVTQWTPRCLRKYDARREVDFPMSYSIPEADGIHLIPDLGLVVSSWTGEVYLIDRVGNNIGILDTRDEGIQAADIAYIPEDDLLLVATFNYNRIMAYKLEPSDKVVRPIKVDPRILSGQDLVQVVSGDDPERELYQNQLFRGNDISVYVVATESKTAVWEDYSLTEFIAPLNGRARIKPVGQEDIYYNTGQAFAVPKGFSGEWETQGGSEYLMELSVIATYPRDTSNNIMHLPKGIPDYLYSGLNFDADSSDSLKSITLFRDNELTIKVSEEKPQLDREYNQEKDELLKVVSGSLTIYVEQEKFDFYPGDYLVLPAGTKGIWRSQALDVLRMVRVYRTE